MYLVTNSVVMINYICSYSQLINDFTKMIILCIDIIVRVIIHFESRCNFLPVGYW